MPFYKVPTTSSVPQRTTIRPPSDGLDLAPPHQRVVSFERSDSVDGSGSAFMELTEADRDSEWLQRGTLEAAVEQTPGDEKCSDLNQHMKTVVCTTLSRFAF